MTLRPLLPATIQINQNGANNLACLDVAAISVSKALLWHSVEVRSRSQIHSLPCLGEDAATRLAADLHSFVNSHLFDLIGSDPARLNDVDAKLMGIVEGQRQYLAHADLARAIAGVDGEAAAALSHPLFDPELMPANLKATLPRSLAFITDPDVRHKYNDAFVSSELSRYRSFFDDLDRRSLSDQQREACIRLEDNNLLVASAGSGKSATMVGKVAYVLDKQLYRPEEILVLAFNKSAADELMERIAQQLSVDTKNLERKVTTFHALGRGIIEEVEGRPPQLADWVEHPAGEARLIEQIIDELLRSDARAEHKMAGYRKAEMGRVPDDVCASARWIAAHSLTGRNREARHCARTKKLRGHRQGSRTGGHQALSQADCGLHQAHPRQPSGPRHAPRARQIPPRPNTRPGICRGDLEDYTNLFPETGSS
ncbi:UvrD-helicase domain-containing protein [Rhizobium sp. Root482]|uniref:UvrD-helicase domain-containing protein n=1 Tax=Rhizobium sp. Root482 TaxID=1736543 RepID=UPI001FCDDB30|nr:UvrD-helicase domain-containing protein [Rhizobium sp. Root482]